MDNKIFDETNSITTFIAKPINSTSPLKKNMTKCILYVKNGVQDVGYRLFIMEKLLNSPMKGGAAINMPDGRVKVLMEGHKDEIEHLITELKTEFPKHAEKVTISEPTYNETLYIPDKMHASQALQLKQFEKSVEYLKPLPGIMQNLGHKMETLDQNTQNGFEKLGNKIDNGFQQQGKKIDTRFNKLSNKIDSGFEKLPKEIARELSPKFD